MTVASMLLGAGALAVCCLAHPASVSAQTFVPPAPAPIVESRPLPAPDPLPVVPRPDRWTGKGEVSYVSTGGNVDTTTAKLAGEVEYKPAKWTMLARAAFVTSTRPDGEHGRRVDGLLRASRRISPRAQLFAQLLYLQNTFAGIDSSFYPLAGVSYALVASRRQDVDVRIGLGYGQESRVRTRDSGFATADSEVNYRWRLSRTAELGQDATLTFNLSRGGDWRGASVTSLTASLNTLLSVKLSHIVSYLNEPVAGFGRVDTITSAAIVATF
jgi:putative salt-induced outer membrane protein YdiY